MNTSLNSYKSLMLLFATATLRIGITAATTRALCLGVPVSLRPEEVIIIREDISRLLMSQSELPITLAQSLFTCADLD